MYCVSDQLLPVIIPHPIMKFCKYGRVVDIIARYSE